MNRIIPTAIAACLSTGAQALTEAETWISQLSADASAAEHACSWGYTVDNNALETVLNRVRSTSGPPSPQKREEAEAVIRDHLATLEGYILGMSRGEQCAFFYGMLGPRSYLMKITRTAPIMMRKRAQ